MPPTKAKSRDHELALAIWRELKKAGKFRRDESQLKTTVEIIEKVIGNHVSTFLNEKLDQNTVSRYNKAEMRKDLIKEIKGGKVEAAKLLADLDNMKNNVDDIIVVCSHYTEVPKLNPDKLMDDYLDSKDSK